MCVCVSGTQVSFLRNFFRGCGLLRDPITRAKLDVMLQQYPVRQRHGSFSSASRDRRDGASISRQVDHAISPLALALQLCDCVSCESDHVRTAGGSSNGGLSQDEFLDILHSFVPRCFPGETQQQALRTFVLRHGLNRLSHYAGIACLKFYLMALVHNAHSNCTTQYCNIVVCRSPATVSRSLL